MYQKHFKRSLDIIMASLGLIFLSPLLLIVAISVKVKLGSPVIFIQQRPGLNEEIFTIYKFRTMTDERDQNGDLLPDKERLNSFGKWLRSTSLDELPELWNILKGDMSFVGPRPLRVSYLPYYTAEERRRHDARPGLTGLAQIDSRNVGDWGKRLQLDVRYIDNMSFGLDMLILFKTVRKVILREDVGIPGVDTMGTLDEIRKLRLGS